MFPSYNTHVSSRIVASNLHQQSLHHGFLGKIQQSMLPRSIRKIPQFVIYMYLIGVFFRSIESCALLLIEVAVVDNSAYLTSKKMKRSKRLLKETSDTSEQENSEDVFKPPPTKVKREFSCLKCHTYVPLFLILKIDCPVSLLPVPLREMCVYCFNLE